MKILVYSCLFPNHLQPNKAIFVKHRMQNVANLDGCEVRVVNPIPYCPRWSFLNRRYPFAGVSRKEVIDGMPVYHPRYPLIPKISMILHGVSLYASSLRLLKRISSIYPFDLIDGHFIYPDGFAAVLLGRTLQKPVVLSARGSDIHQFSNFRSIKPMIRFALKGADHVVSVCQSLKNTMVELGVESGKVSVIPNGIDLNHFFPEDRLRARGLLGLPEDARIVLSVGALIPLKGHELVLEAFRGMIQKRTNLHLYIIGEGPQRDILQRKAKEMNLSHHVIFVGQRPNSELRNWYNAANVFCLASSQEGNANVILESLACGTPVVATDVGGAPEILISPDVGILVIRNQSSLRNGLLSALERSWDRAEIHRHVAERTWHQVAKEVRTVFDLTLNQWDEGRIPAN
jgi:glycosyltransferase involved in cell wall biosynthesis